jgi:23S rRNA pseudouridine1911/1915/1917 synthase
MTLAIEIIYEDRDVLVVNKPAGLKVHGDGLNQETTLADWLLSRDKSLVTVGETIISPLGQTIIRPGIVHRLDKDTSGVLILAKNQNAYNHLKQEFKTRQTEKEYRLIVEGQMKLKLNQEEKIDIPIGRSRKDPRKRLAHEKAVGKLRDAQTIYTVLEKFENYTYLSARLITGRTHQIRVHFKAINYPLVGDFLYNSHWSDNQLINRLALHAYRLKIKIPSGERKEFKTELPADFSQALEKLRSL